MKKIDMVTELKIREAKCWELVQQFLENGEPIEDMSDAKKAVFDRVVTRWSVTHDILTSLRIIPFTVFERNQMKDELM